MYQGHCYDLMHNAVACDTVIPYLQQIIPVPPFQSSSQLMVCEK